MDLTNEFEVAVPVEHAWAVLTDVERIAPCMPGAQLKEVEGEEYRGVVKVKVGPITASYNGAARFLELDEANHRAVLKAEGRESRGQGNASATITAVLTASPAGTKVDVTTDLNITGKVAQFGRGVLADVSAKLLDQFVHNLETTVLSDQGSDPAASEEKPAAGASADEPDSPTPAEPEGEAPRGEAPEAPAPRRRRAGRSRASSAMPSSTADGSEGAIPEEGGAAETVHEEAPAEEAPAEAVADAGSSTEEAPVSAGPRTIDSPEPVPVDLAAVAGPSLVRRVAPFASVAGVLVLIRIVIYALKRRKR
jgi:carbon monoxide dehydrogenase subunit G